MEEAFIAHLYNIGERRGGEGRGGEGVKASKEANEKME